MVDRDKCLGAELSFRRGHRAGTARQRLDAALRIAYRTRWLPLGYERRGCWRRWCCRGGCTGDGAGAMGCDASSAVAGGGADLLSKGHLLDPLQAMAYQRLVMLRRMLVRRPDLRPPVERVAPAGAAGCGRAGRPRAEGGARAGLGVNVADADASAGMPGPAGGELDLLEVDRGLWHHEVHEAARLTRWRAAAASQATSYYLGGLERGVDRAATCRLLRSDAATAYEKGCLRTLLAGAVWKQGAAGPAAAAACAGTPAGAGAGRCTQDADAALETYSNAGGVRRVVLWTDGASSNNQFERERRAGLGVFYAKGHSLNLGVPLPGLMQTNNRGELHGVAFAIEHDPRCLDVRSNSEHVLDGWNATRDGSRDELNKDLWARLARLRLARAHRNGVPDMLSWVKGHAKAADVASDVTTAENKAGNDGADDLATDGADAHAVDVLIVEALEWRRRVTRELQRMMVQIQYAQWERKCHRAPVPAPPLRRRRRKPPGQHEQVDVPQGVPPTGRWGRFQSRALKAAGERGWAPEMWHAVRAWAGALRWPSEAAGGEFGAKDISWALLREARTVPDTPMVLGDATDRVGSLLAMGYKHPAGLRR
eukprot:gene1203-481_t